MNLRIGKMMDRWLQVVTSISFNLFIGGNVWAVCDAEFNSFISKYKENADSHVGVARGILEYSAQHKINTESVLKGKGPRLDEATREVKTWQDYPDLRRNPLTREALSFAQYKLCLANESMKIVAESTNSAHQQKGNDSQASDPQQRAQQAQQLAQQNQARADQARQGKRRRHEPENEASQCIQPDFGGLYGGMKNTCDFKVWYTYCGYRPKENSWLTGMNCEKQSFGSDSVGPGRTSAAHTKGVEMLYWIACKEPAWTVDTEFVPGQGLRGRCHTVGGN